jgi:hypothetical protein
VREDGLKHRLSLSLSPSRMLVTPYRKRIRPVREEEGSGDGRSCVVKTGLGRVLL